MNRYLHWSITTFILCNCVGVFLVYQCLGMPKFAQNSSLFVIPAFTPHIGFSVLKLWQRISLKNRIKSALRKIGLRNMEKEYPSVKNLRVGNDNTISFRLTRESIPFKKFEDSGSGLESSLRGTITSMKDNLPGGFVDVTISTKEQAKRFMFPASITLPDFSFLIGQRFGKILTSDFRSAPHVLIAGETSSGKSTFVRQLIYSLYKNNEDSRYVLIDLKGGLEFKLFEKLERVEVAPDLDFAVQLLDGIDQEMHRRKFMFADCGATDIDALNKQLPKEKLPRIFVFVDELAEIFLPGLDQNKDMIKRVRVHLSKIARLGRAFGIHLVVATQRPDSKAIDGQIKSNLGAKLCFKVTNDISSRIVLDDPIAARIPPVPGRAVWSRGMDLVEIQTPFLPVDTCKRRLNLVDTPRLPEKFRNDSGEVFTARASTNAG